MNAMTKIVPCIRAQVMICNARDEYGVGNPVSEGAVALAEFLAEHQDEERTSGLIMFLGGWASVVRMLADDLMPGNDWGEEMGRVSDGAVTPNLWRRAYAGEIERAELPPVEHIVIAPALPVGLLGTVPPGRLFAFTLVDGEPNAREIRGLGLGLSLSEAALAAMRDTCTAAIADIRANS